MKYSTASSEQSLPNAVNACSLLTLLPLYKPTFFISSEVYHKMDFMDMLSKINRIFLNKFLLETLQGIFFIILLSFNDLLCFCWECKKVIMIIIIKAEYKSYLQS